MKKLISTLCAFAMLFTMVGSLTASAEIPAQNATMTVTIEDGVSIADMQVGDTFDVSVSYAGITGLQKTNGNNQTGITIIQFKMIMPEGFEVDVADGTYPEELFTEDRNPYMSELASYVNRELTFAVDKAGSKSTWIQAAEGLLLTFPVKVTAVPTEDVTFNITSEGMLIINEIASGTLLDNTSVAVGNGLTYVGDTLTAPELDYTPAVALEGGSEVANTFWYEAAYEAKGQAIESTTIEVVGADKTKTFTVNFDNNEDLEGTIKFLMGVKNAPAGEYVGTASIVTAAGTAASEAVAVTVAE